VQLATELLLAEMHENVDEQQAVRAAITKILHRLPPVDSDDGDVQMIEAKEEEDKEPAVKNDAQERTLFVPLLDPVTGYINRHKNKYVRSRPKH
jgi:hypothetical protein